MTCYEQTLVKFQPKPRPYMWFSRFEDQQTSTVHEEYAQLPTSRMNENDESV